MTGHMFHSFETYVIENRRQPRYQVDEVGTLCGVPVRVRNLSRTGAQLACSPENLAQIGPNLSRSPVPVELRLQALLSLTADVVYTIERDGQHFMGIRFVQVSQSAQALLDEYIAAL